MHPTFESRSPSASFFESSSSDRTGAETMALRVLHKSSGSPPAGASQTFGPVFGCGLEFTGGNFGRKAIQVVRENLMDCDLTAEVLSRKLAVSRRQLFRKFKLQLNCTPNVFIRQSRLKLAARLLKESGMTISEIIYSVGFSDPKYFRTIFRREYGVLPSEYGGRRIAKSVTSADVFASSQP